MQNTTPISTQAMHRGALNQQEAESNEEFETPPAGSSLSFPRPSDLAQIARRAGGNLRDTPLATLLSALYFDRRSCIIEIQRRHLWKRIVLEEGRPVQSRSNNLHNTFSYYLREIGRISPTQYSTYLARAMSREVPFGEIVVEEGVLTHGEVLGYLQKLLARVLLNGFSWAEGDYEISQAAPEIDAPLKIRVPQLILTGVTRFAPGEPIAQALADLPSGRWVANPHAPADAQAVAQSSELVPLLNYLRDPREIEDIRAWVSGADERARGFSALATLQLVSRTEELEIAPAEPISVVDFKPPSRLDREMPREELNRLFLDHRRMDSCDLLGIGAAAERAEIESSYLRMVSELVPWFQSSEASEVQGERARALVLAAARALISLSAPNQSDTHQKNLHKRQAVEDRPLLDPGAHHAAGVALLDDGDFEGALYDLEYAADCEPHRGVYQAYASYCRYRCDPSRAEGELEALAETQRLDPSCGLTLLFAGEIAMALDQEGRAEKLLRQATKLMAPDRRPVEKLHELRQRKLLVT